MVFGRGLEYNRTNLFWDGLLTNDNAISYFNGFSMPVYSSTQILNNVSFLELMMFINSTNFSKYKSQTSSTTWTQKKANTENIAGLIWNYNCVSGGFTSCNYVLGANNGSFAHGDYYATGLGLSGGASSFGSFYGTRHYRYSGYINCGNTEGCTTNYNYISSASIGSSGHRYIDGTTYLGLFIR